MQTDGKTPPDKTQTTLTAEEIAVCKAMGLKEEDFLKSKGEAV
jgi:phage I-like protein